MTFDTSAPLGHLPGRVFVTGVFWVDGGFESLLSHPDL
ncbi:hypothetical protein [Halomicronema hongdechloris]